MDFKDGPHGIFLRYRTSRKLFNLQRLVTNTKVQNVLIQEFLYPDDRDLFAHSERNMQHLIDLFCYACTSLGLTIRPLLGINLQY